MERSNRKIATEVWEINEKNINDLYFRYHGGLLDRRAFSEN